MNFKYFLSAVSFALFTFCFVGLNSQAVQAAEVKAPLSQCTEAGNLVFTSGQLGFAPNSSKLLEGIEAQTRQSLENVKAALEACGSSMDNVVKTTVFIKELDHFSGMNGVYRTFFTKKFPARSTVEVARLYGDALIEIEAIGVKK